MINSRMIADAATNADLGGTCAPVQTAIASMTIYSANRPAKPVPALFDPRFYLLLQGTKRLMIAGQNLALNPGGCAISTLGLPFHTEVIDASPDKPYLGVAFKLNPALVSELLPSLPRTVDTDASAFASGKVTEDIVEPIARLLALLRSPSDIPVMAPLLERELIYRLAQGPMGGMLIMAVRRQTHFAQVQAVAEWIKAHADKPMQVKTLASQVGMSVTSLHRHFRAITGTSPLAYQRHIRLLAARDRIISNSQTVTAAAFASGYASTSQFSREYKQMFGEPPARDRPRNLQKGGQRAF